MTGQSGNRALAECQRELYNAPRSKRLTHKSQKGAWMVKADEQGESRRVFITR